MPVAPPRSRAATDACVTCGTPTRGDYCTACGERRPHEHDLRLRSFLASGLSDLLDLDSRGYRSFRALLGRPGHLTAEYVAGRRTPWLTPFQIFIICNVVFFIGVGFVPMNALTTSLGSQTNGQVYSEFARDVLRSRDVASYPGGFDGYSAAYGAMTEQYAKSLVLVLVPGFAAILALLLLLRREPFVKHLVFALHTVAVLLLILLALGAALGLVSRLGAVNAGSWLYTESAFALGFGLLFAPYLYLGLRRAYDMARPAAAAAALIAFFSLPILLLGYRFLLFMVVVYSL